MQVQPYLFFDGRCEEAIAFYKGAIGAEPGMLMRFKDGPERPASLPPGAEDKVMHAELRIGESTLLLSDGHCAGQPSFQGFGLALAAADEAEADRLFNALAEDGTVLMALARTFFSPRFGMLKDRFGVQWMIVTRG